MANAVLAAMGGGLNKTQHNISNVSIYSPSKRIQQSQ
jgi:hypothetical protein